MPLPKRVIEIRDHAYHRAVERFGMTKAKATAAIRRILRKGTWYENPSTPHEFLVVGRVNNRPACTIAKGEQGKIVVTTVFFLRNTTRVRAYQLHRPGVSANEIHERYCTQTW